MPGTNVHYQYDHAVESAYSFPGGNAGILRHIVKHLLPESIEGGRSFEGFGNFFAIRRPMQTGEATQPFDPDKPTVMTFYVPFNNPCLPAKAQGIFG